MIIDWKKVALKIYDIIKKEVSGMSKNPTLWAILVWDNESSLRYINQKRKWAEYVWINFVLKRLAKDISEKELLDVIDSFNKDEDMSGYITQLPLPEHIDENKIINAISPEKDVDGFHPINQWKIMVWDDSGFAPCTPAGIIELLHSTEIGYVGKQVVVIGRSNIVWKPIINMLINQGATVISCNSKTPSLKKFTLDADIIITAAWKPWLLTANMIKKEAVVIDVWFTVIDGHIYGDAETKSIDELWAKITPVPGWVWALTVAMLMKNTLRSFKK